MQFKSYICSINVQISATAKSFVLCLRKKNISLSVPCHPTVCVLHSCRSDMPCWRASGESLTFLHAISLLGHKQSVEEETSPSEQPVATEICI